MKYLTLMSINALVLLSGCVGAGIQATKQLSEDTKDTLNLIQAKGLEARDVYRSTLINIPNTAPDDAIKDQEFIHFVCKNPYSELQSSAKVINSFRETVNEIATAEPKTLGATLGSLAKNADYFNPQKPDKENKPKPTCEERLIEAWKWNYSFNQPRTQALSISVILNYADKLTALLKIIEKAEREAALRKLASEANNDENFKKAIDQLPVDLIRAARDVEGYLVRTSYTHFSESKNTNITSSARLGHLQESIKLIALYEKSKSKDFQKIGDGLVDVYKKYFAYMSYKGASPASLLDDLLLALSTLKNTSNAISELKAIGEDKQPSSPGGSGVDM